VKISHFSSLLLLSLALQEHATGKGFSFGLTFCCQERPKIPSGISILRSQKEEEYPLINFQEIFHPTCCYLSLPVYQFSRKFPASLFSPEQMKKFPPYPLIKFEEKFQFTLL
jgi:hypothetical protein